MLCTLEGDWIDEIVGLKGVNADVAFIIAPEGEPKVELLCYKSPTGRVNTSQFRCEHYWTETHSA